MISDTYFAKIGRPVGGWLTDWQAPNLFRMGVFKKEQALLKTSLQMPHRGLRNASSHRLWFHLGTVLPHSQLKDISAQLLIQTDEGIRSPQSPLDTQNLSCHSLTNAHKPAEEECAGLTLQRSRVCPPSHPSSARQRIMMLRLAERPVMSHQPKCKSSKR